MKVDEGKSAFVIDRRAGAVGAIAAVLGALAGALGARATAATDHDADLVSIVSTALDRGQAFWAARAPYRPAYVVLFAGQTATACGPASADTGPFYCPADERIYLDLSFLRELDNGLARAYVLAHELGHHVQHVRGDHGPGVALELGADCNAGVWIADELAKGLVTKGDVDAALDLAAAVGDDRLSPGLAPEQWTHGSSAQRAAALHRGLNGASCSVNETEGR